MPQLWQFEQDDDAQWRWRRLDEAEGRIESSEAFPREVDCMIDAVRFAVHRRKTAAEVGGDTLQ